MSISKEDVQRSSASNQRLMLNSSHSHNSEKGCKLFDLNDLLIQSMDCGEGFQTENKT